MQMLRPLLSPVLWERSGNVTALVRLLRAYLSKAAQEIVQTNTLTVSNCHFAAVIYPLSDDLVMAASQEGDN